jgi:Glyoxalase/Bleomycin resistance protein/Dioxygenase superfamily
VANDTHALPNRRDCGVLLYMSRAEFLSGTIKGVHHVALITEDLDKSLEFYVGVLGAAAVIDSLFSCCSLKLTAAAFSPAA